MAVPPIYADRHRTTCVPGANTETTSKLLVVCMDDPVATPVTVVCNGVNYVSGTDFTLTAYGVAWTGALTVTGLSSNTRYDWSVTQGSESDSGTLSAAPANDDDFSLFIMSCDNNTNLSNKNDAHPSTVTGIHAAVKAHIQASNLNCAGITFIDDFGYVDGLGFTDDFTGASGLVSERPAVGTENTVSMTWLSVLGCTGGSGTVLHTELDTVTNNWDLKAHWGREENRAWNRKNNNMIFQWGDHEFDITDIAYQVDATGTVTPADLPNTRWTTYQGTEGLGATAYKAFIGKCQPNSISSADAYANHWGLDIGCLHITTCDAITNGTGDWSANDESPAQMTSVYGNNQIDDVKSDLTGSNKAFKILGMPSGIKYLGKGATSLNSHFAQYPLFNQCVAEFKRLFTDATDSLMRHKSTTGVGSNLLVVTGDMHRSCVLRHHSDNYASNQSESFDQWTTGSVNHYSNFLNASGLVAGDEFVGTDGRTKAKVLFDQSEDTYGFHCLRLDVCGSESPKRMVVNVMDKNGNDVYSQEYKQSEGNSGKPVGTPPQTQSVASTD